MPCPRSGTSLTGRVPVLVDGDFSLSESSAIVDCLEERYAAPAFARLLPADVRDRARARQILASVRSDVTALREERPTWRVFYEPDDNMALPKLSPQARRGAEKVLAIAEQIVPAGGGPLFGDCVADTDLAMMLLRLVRTGEHVPMRLRDDAEAQWRRPSLRAPSSTDPGRRTPRRSSHPAVPCPGHAESTPRS
ncbi:MAG: glutathione transferase [Myxococcales bacterium]|nr:glutathione transferase [Myxococcales bacterium]